MGGREEPITCILNNPQMMMMFWIWGPHFEKQGCRSIKLSSNTWTKRELCMHAQSLSRVWLFATLWTVAHQAPLSVKFPRQEYWSGLPFPPPGDLPGPGIEITSPEAPALAGRFFTTKPPGKPQKGIEGFINIDKDIEVKSYAKDHKVFLSNCVETQT